MAITSTRGIVDNALLNHYNQRNILGSRDYKATVLYTCL